MENLLDRMKHVIEAQTDAHRRFKDLEERTGLKATAWQNFWMGRQRPTWEMIELVGRTWPEFAFWLVTGIDDPEHGHQQISRYHRPQQRKATAYFAAKLRSKKTGEIFDEAMRRAHLVREAEGEMAGHARYVFAPEDEGVFGEQIRTSEDERTAFIEREAEDSEVVAEVLGRYRGMKKLEKPEEMKVYAPITGKPAG
jgi:hypothetical protein